MSNKEELLHDILCEDCSRESISASAIITTIRREKRTRQVRKATSGFIAFLCFFLIAYHLLSLHNNTPIDLATSTPKQPTNLQIINDKQLLNLLSDQPTALVLLPNGERRLILVSSDASAMSDLNDSLQ